MIIAIGTNILATQRNSLEVREGMFGRSCSIDQRDLEIMFHAYEMYVHTGEVGFEVPVFGDINTSRDLGK